ncbi:hypothetical protein [Thermoanaerobacterium thermosaccharolyticum]|uniref:hypothetical protein n=1 Tax=Thermoanaerobacterium thermosaccharolyticum TaxID=1517 RepID=UPI003DA97E0F
MLHKLNIYSNLITAIATIILAVITAVYAVITEKQVKTSRENIELTKKSIEHMEDEFMPVIDILTIKNKGEFVVKQGEKIKSRSSLSIPITIEVKNCGNGVAFIENITTRCELSGTGIINRYNNFIIGKDNLYSLQLNDISNDINVFQEKDIISSLSIWYKDLYGRYYRSRLLFQYKNNNDIEKINLEYIKVPDDVYNSFFKNQQIFNFNMAENGMPVPYNNCLQTHKIYEIKNLIKNINDYIDKHKNKIKFPNVKLLDIGYWYAGSPYPTLKCSINNNRAFVMVKHDNKKEIELISDTGFYANIEKNGKIISIDESFYIHSNKYFEYGLESIFQKGNINELYTQFFSIFPYNVEDKDRRYYINLIWRVINNV